MDPRLPYLDAFARLAPRLAGELPVLRHARERAMARFTHAGFPTARDEAWRFTSLAGLLGASFAPALAADLDEETAAAVAAAVRPSAGFDLGGPRLVFVDGHFAASLSALGELAGDVLIGRLGEALTRRPLLLAPGFERDAEEGETFVALNAALSQDGALLRVPRGAALEAPLSLVFVATRGRAAYPRSVLALEEGSRATVVETYLALGPAASFTNAVTTVALGAGAALEHCRVTGGGGFHVGRVTYRLGAGAELRALALARGGALQRHDVVAEVGAEAAATLDGLSLAGGAEQLDHHLLVDHAAPGGRSRATYKGIFDDQAHGVFEGAVLVRPAAQRTDAMVANHNLLLSDDATVNSKPQFNIHADDVKCIHGATVGQLREEELFYLRSRGIPHDEARALLLQAFAAEVVLGVRPERLRPTLDRLIVEWLPRGARREEAA